jgi:hypothetical protein
MLYLVIIKVCQTQSLHQDKDSSHLQLEPKINTSVRPNKGSSLRSLEKN